MKSPNDWYPYFAASVRRFSDYYLCYAQTHVHDFEALDQELANFQTARARLTAQGDLESAERLIAFIKTLTVYLSQRALNSELLAYCQSGLPACEKLGINPAWLLLLRCEAFELLGEWDRALVDAQNAIKVSSDGDPDSHARATLALGRLQLNRGDYRKAFDTLTKAERLLADLQDFQGVASAKSEIAAYLMFCGEFDRAHVLFLEVDQLQKRVGATETSDHMLFMLGIVLRKKGDHQGAIEFLQDLLNRGKERNDPRAVSGAAHHLAWVYLDQETLAEARHLGNWARQVYIEIGDTRGASDVDELLGLIALVEDNENDALLFLERSLAARKRLGNKHGIASSLRRLAMVRFHQGNLLAGTRDLWRSLVLYHRLSILNRHRLLRIFKELWRWTVGRKY